VQAQGAGARAMLLRHMKTMTLCMTGLSHAAQFWLLRILLVSVYRADGSFLANSVSD